PVARVDRVVHHEEAQREIAAVTPEPRARCELSVEPTEAQIVLGFNRLDPAHALILGRIRARPAVTEVVVDHAGALVDALGALRRAATPRRVDGLDHRPYVLDLVRVDGRVPEIEVTERSAPDVGLGAHDGLRAIADPVVGRRGHAIVLRPGREI